jgi:transcriptional regulator with XRE-family HTH domain
LTQTQLARRLGTTQPAIARLERDATNPTMRTLEETLRAMGKRLKLTAEAAPPSVDESLIRQHLERTPEQRIAGLEVLYEDARAIALAGQRARGELA